MRYVTVRQMQRIDRRAIKEFGIPSLVLMENAGSSAACAAFEMLKDLKKQKVICVCGKGNNAGDGFVCARHLINNGVNTDLFLTAKPSKSKRDAKINFGILKKMKAKITFLRADYNLKVFKEKLKAAELVVDAIFGIGLFGEVKEPYASIIKAMNESGKPILAVDVPSGLDAGTGKILGVCVKAERTITFGLPKAGFIKRKGHANIGKLTVADISIPKVLLK